MGRPPVGTVTESVVSRARVFLYEFTGMQYLRFTATEPLNKNIVSQVRVGLGVKF